MSKSNLEISENDYEIIPSKDGYYSIKFSRNPKLGFDFDFQIYVPETVREDANILLSFSKEFDGRAEAMLDTLHAPIMITDVKNDIDINGNEINFKQFEMSSLVSKDGEKVGYGNSETSIIEQYAKAIEAAYSVLKDRQVIQADKEEKVDVEGYSYHGVRAQRLALLMPENIRSVFCGGAISSMPIPMKQYNGVELTYPTGLSGIENIAGEENMQELIENYQQVVQVVYATEQELKYDGNFTIDGTRIQREVDGAKIDYSQISVSQHDISPDVVDTVVTQVELFGTDINDRIEGARKLIQGSGCELKTKIYADTDHHFTDMKGREELLEDLRLAITSMDQAEKGRMIDASQLKGFDDGAERIDTSYETKRTEIQNRLSKAQSREEHQSLLEGIVAEMAQTPQESEKFLFEAEKGFIKDITPEMIKSAKTREISINMNQLTRNALEQGVTETEISTADRVVNQPTKDNQKEGVSLDEQ